MYPINSITKSLLDATVIIAIVNDSIKPVLQEKSKVTNS